MTVIDPTGTVTSVPGFRAGAVYAGMKTFGNLNKIRLRNNNRITQQSADP